MISSKYAAQKPLKFLNAVMHQPTISEIMETIPKEKDFFMCLRIFTQPLKQLMEFEEDVSDIVLIVSMMNNEQFSYIYKFFEMLFPTYEVSITPQSIILTQEEQGIVLIIDESNFKKFRLRIKLMFKTDVIFNSEEDKYNPQSEKGREIAEKLKERHKKLAEMRGENKEPVLENYLHILSVGLKMPMEFLTKYTMYNLISIYERFRMQEEWDMDIRCRLAGGDPKEHPDYWMKLI